MTIPSGQPHATSSQQKGGPVAQQLALLSKYKSQQMPVTSRNIFSYAQQQRSYIMNGLALICLLLGIIMWRLDIPLYYPLLFVVVGLMRFILLGYTPRFSMWTGFGVYEPPTDKYQRKKTLWDWLQLLIIPAILAGGGLWFGAQQYNQGVQLASDQQKETALTTTMNDLSSLLLNNGLRDSPQNAEVRVVARAKTLSALSVLDPLRKHTLLEFLIEAQIVTSIKGQKPILSLSSADLEDTDLDIINLSGANLSGANLSGATLSYANLNGTNLVGANLSSANLIGANLSSANLVGANLSNADLSDAKLDNINLSSANLSRTNLSGDNLSGNNLFDVTLNGANLNSAILRGTDLRFADLSDADLSDANLSDANLSDANLSDANLSDSYLGEANLSYATLSSANLSGATLSGANLSHAILSGTTMPNGSNHP